MLGTHPHEQAGPDEPRGNRIGIALDLDGEEADGVPLSPERQAQWHTAELDYQQAREVIDQALARILRHFPTEGAILHQARCERLLEIASPSPTASSLLPEASCVAPTRSRACKKEER
ncbi:MAG: hypothetical protein IMW89_20370 [Ktedonobacteraceae bacterium]|nr:hypothetical protein [Ktedonobacteraceae bacterium]